MKYIYLNLKRFDVPAEYGGVNRIAASESWGEYIVRSVEKELQQYQKGELEFAAFLPEAHILGATRAQQEDSILQIGCQGVYREDTAPGGNFGAFTTQRTANSMKALGCGCTIIGHCEERRDKAGILMEAGVKDTDAINRLLNQEIKAAVKAGMKVLYCIGETAEEQERWQEVLGSQLRIGLEGISREQVVIAYEPVWAIGPGKTPPDREYIKKIASYVKEVTQGVPVVYGGGLKVENASMLASIPEIDGGLIALTRFQGEIGFYPEEYLEIIRTYLA
jgi:triosephosphate isomerase